MTVSSKKSGLYPVPPTNPSFQVWGLTWEPLPYFSVFLVLLISVLRTIGIVIPLYSISKTAVRAAITTYLVFLVARSVGLLLLQVPAILINVFNFHHP